MCRNGWKQERERWAAAANTAYNNNDDNTTMTIRAI